MDRDQNEGHWRPGQPWRPRGDEPAAPADFDWQTDADQETDEAAGEEEENVTVVVPDESKRYGDVPTRMMSKDPGEAGRGDDVPGSPSSPTDVARTDVAPADRTTLMPVIETSPPPRHSAPTSRSSAPPPPPPPAPARRSDQPPRPRRRGRFIRRLLILVMILVVLVGAGLFWVESQLERVPTPSLAGGLGNETFLIVGSDSRENLPDDLEGSFGSFEGQRADVVILAHVSGGTVQMLSLPRDLKVEIPGRGTDKINAAYAYGGGDLLAETIQTDLGVPIARYMEVEFGGFAEIVDAVGGIELTFEHPTRDLKTGLDVPAGTQVVDGATALAYVRSRSTEESRDGDWRGADGGDIARTGRQREVLEGVIAKALSPSGLVRIPVLVPAVTSAMTVGEQTHSWNLGLFGFRFATASGSESMALPVVIANEGGVSYVVQTEEAGPAISAFVSGDPLPVPEDEAAG